MAGSPDVIAYRCQREFRTISLTVAVPILCRHGTGGAVRTAQAVHADHEEARHVKGPSIAAQQGTPPVAHIGAARKSMTNDHCVVGFRRQLSLGGVCHRNVVENMARLEGEGRDDCYLLVWDQSCKRVLGL